MRDGAHGIWHGGAVGPGVKIGGACGQVDLTADEPFEADGEGWFVNPHHAAVAGHDDVRLEFGREIGNHLWQVGATNFFLAFQKQDEIERQLTVDCGQRFDPLENAEQIHLHVRRAPGIDLAVTLGWLERIRFPKLDRIDWLDIVVTVDQ